MVSRALEPSWSCGAPSPSHAPTALAQVPLNPEPAVLTLGVYVTADLVGSRHPVTYTVPADRDNTSGSNCSRDVDVHAVNDEASNESGTPTIAMCPRASGADLGGNRVDDASEHISDTAREGARPYAPAAAISEPTMLGAYLLRHRVANACIRKGR